MNHIVPVRSDLIDFDVIGADGDEEDTLKREVKLWLKAHCIGAWEFYHTIGELAKVEEPDGQVTESHERTYSIAFELENDAILFKLRWQ